MTTASASARGRARTWERVRLHVVTGKGGTGKTTAASALAIALASRQTTPATRVLLAEVEGRQGISQTFDVPPLGTEETRIARTTVGRRDRRDLRRRQGRPPRVPAAVLQARPRGQAPREVRGHRLRHHHRPGSPRRPRHRQALRSQPTTQGRQASGSEPSGIRRHRHGRPADGAHRALPQRQLGGGRPRPGRSDPQPGRLDHGAPRERPDARPHRHTARGDAGAGDPRSDRRAARQEPQCRRDHRQHGPAAAPRRRGARAGSHQPAAQAVDRQPAHGCRCQGDARARRRAARGGPRPRAPGRPRERAAGDPAADWPAAPAAPSAARGGRLRARSASWPTSCGTGSWRKVCSNDHDGNDRSRRAARPDERARPGRPVGSPARHRRHDRRQGGRDRRVLRLRRGRQDDDGRRARPACGRGRPAGGRADDRPGQAPRPGPRPDRARQHPATG